MEEVTFSTNRSSNRLEASGFFRLHKSPAVICISLSILLCCGSGGMGEGLLSLPLTKAGTSYLLLIEACSCQTV